MILLRTREIEREREREVARALGALEDDGTGSRLGLGLARCDALRAPGARSRRAGSSIGVTR